MVNLPNKKIIGLLGPPRSGKDAVAEFLVETRDFKRVAFADKIKEECGISIEDFEAAKISGDIAKVRKKLWDFSTHVRKDNPNYFIRLVTSEAKRSNRSVVITDIRTEDEFCAILNIGVGNPIMYMVGSLKDAWEPIVNSFEECSIKESKISNNFYNKHCALNNIKHIDNDRKGLFLFYKSLEYYFFKEDIMDLIGPADSSDSDEHKQTETDKRTMVSNYISQFDVREKV